MDARAGYDNRVDEDSLRDASMRRFRLAHSQPKDPKLLPLLGGSAYRTVNRSAAPTTLSRKNRAVRSNVPATSR